MGNKTKIIQLNSSACSEMRDSKNEKRLNTDDSQYHKNENHKFSYFLSPCCYQTAVRMKTKITIKHFCMALQANVNQDHLFS